MSCVQTAKHSRSTAWGLHEHCPAYQCQPAWLHGYFQDIGHFQCGIFPIVDISRESHCWAALRGHPHGPCRMSKLGWKETPLRRHFFTTEQLLHHRKLCSSTKGQNHGVTSVTSPSAGHGVSWVLPPPPSGALLLRARSTQQRALSNVQRAQKLYEPAGHRERTIHFYLEMGY